MISNDEVKNLAALARVAITTEEEQKLAGELGQILDYVAELKNAPKSEPASVRPLADFGAASNLREDISPIPSLEKGEFVKVKKIL